MSQSSKLNLVNMQSEAKKLQTDFLTTSEDWHDEITKIWKANEQVRKWQLLMQRAFGKPRWRDTRGHWHDMEVGHIFEKMPETWNVTKLSFNHACIIQIQAVEEKDQRKIIHYRAELRLDEQAFLNDLLPKSVEQVDPIYKLIEIKIEIPKEQVVSESIRTMNEKMENLSTKKSRIKHDLKENWLCIPIFIAIDIFLWLLFGIVGRTITDTYMKDTCTHWICGTVIGIPYGIIISLGASLLIYFKFRGRMH